jgi:hypothetical protein
VRFYRSQGHSRSLGDLLVGQTFEEGELQNLPLIRGELIQYGLGLLHPSDLIHGKMVLSWRVEAFGERFEGRAAIPLPSSVDEAASGDHRHETTITGSGWLKTVGAFPQVEKHLLNSIFRVRVIDGPSTG